FVGPCRSKSCDVGAIDAPGRGTLFAATFGALRPCTSAPQSCSAERAFGCGPRSCREPPVAARATEPEVRSAASLAGSGFPSTNTANGEARASASALGKLLRDPGGRCGV